MKTSTANRGSFVELQTFQFGDRRIRFSPTIEQIPFSQVMEGQVNTTLVLDCDGTIARHNDPNVDPVVNDVLLQLFSEGVFRKLILISNNSKYLTQQRARNLHVVPDAMYTPSKLVERKPSSRMINAAMNDCGVDPANVLAVGDGITDAIAYTRAGVDSAIVHPYGTCESKGYPLRQSVRKASNFILKSLGVNRCPDVARA
jgi:predicted HAD superfamily phosphohydrolase YqeG